jgi:hypothetical protein
MRWLWATREASRAVPPAVARLGVPQTEVARPDVGRLRDLLDRASRGDEGAFAALYDATSGSIYGLVLGDVQDRARALHITAEVYLQAWASAPLIDCSRVEPTLWLACMAAHEIDLERGPRSQPVRV